MVDWSRRTILIPSPKTACHGKSERLVPLFPEVLPFLKQQLEEVGKSLRYLFPTLRNHKNLGTTARKFVKRAKCEVWVSFWNALRANRETDLMDAYGIRKGLCLDWELACSRYEEQPDHHRKRF
jgi:integrase